MCEQVFESDRICIDFNASINSQSLHNDIVSRMKRVRVDKSSRSNTRHRKPVVT